MLELLAQWVGGFAVTLVLIWLALLCVVLLMRPRHRGVRRGWWGRYR